jgi:hypothetical protein
MICSLVCWESFNISRYRSAALWHVLLTFLSEEVEIVREQTMPSYGSPIGTSGQRSNYTRLLVSKCFSRNLGQEIVENGAAEDRGQKER